MVLRAHACAWMDIFMTENFALTRATVPFHHLTRAKRVFWTLEAGATQVSTPNTFCGSSRIRRRAAVLPPGFEYPNCHADRPTETSLKRAFGGFHQADLCCLSHHC